jgi:hypothetical protein
MEVLKNYLILHSNLKLNIAKRPEHSIVYTFLSLERDHVYFKCVELIFLNPYTGCFQRNLLSLCFLAQATQSKNSYHYSNYEYHNFSMQFKGAEILNHKMLMLQIILGVMNHKLGFEGKYVKHSRHSEINLRPPIFHKYCC